REEYQLCLTNEAMRRQFIANTLGWLGDHPGTICVSVSQNDYPEPCTCARCSAAIRELGSPTDLLLHFLNGVADAVERDYPGTVVETLAYQWTRKPPVTVRPRPNIMIRLCSIECSMNHPLDHEANRHFYDDLLGWAALTSNLYIWHYTLNAHNLAIPHPYAYGTAALLRQLSAFRVTGVFLQGDGFNLRGNFHELKAWVYAKLLWDPQQDEQALIDAFIDGYYGPAAPAIRSLWQMLHGRMRESGQYYGCFFRNLASYYDAYEKVLPQITTASWLDPADLNAAADWLDAAEAAAAGEPKYAARAADCRIAFDAVRLQDEAGLRLLARQSGLPFRGPAASEEGAVERFAARAAERFADYHVEGWRFGQGYTDYLQKRHIRLLDGADGAPAVEVSGSVFTQMTSARVHFRERNRATRTVDDPASARGTAAVLAPEEVADDRALAFVHNLACFYYYRAEGRWDIRLDIRCDTAAASGIVFRVQLVDILAGCIVAETPGLAEHLQAGVYRTYGLGAHRLRDGLFVRVAIADRASVAGVYLDRMLLTQAKEGERLEIGH
ncbi:MAG: DUF4838 domain-containing protein, partial [Paenibacillaceae bacterium]|nr:DUF4838 domain-containing protein [Paenibacillaceae bacterium]